MDGPNTTDADLFITPLRLLNFIYWMNGMTMAAHLPHFYTVNTSDCSSHRYFPPSRPLDTSGSWDGVDYWEWWCCSDFDLLFWTDRSLEILGRLTMLFPQSFLYLLVAFSFCFSLLTLLIDSKLEHFNFHSLIFTSVFSLLPSVGHYDNFISFSSCFLLLDLSNFLFPFTLLCFWVDLIRSSFPIPFYHPELLIFPLMCI